MSEDLTPRQQILLWDLVSRGGSAMQKDLKPEVKPADREPLKRAKLISVIKGAHNALGLTIEEAGWDHIAARQPTLLNDGSKYDRQILQFVLSRIQSYATQSNTAFATIFARTSDLAVERKQTSVASTEQAIRTAFFEIAGRPARDHVRLSALRARLGHIGRAEVDSTLLAMRRAGKANLMNLDNPRDIEAEEDAALQSGMQTFHVAWIEE